jgi:hypothetical protein
LVRQDRREIIVELRTGDGWHTEVLHDADQLALPEFGLICPIKDVYRGTPLG